MALCKEWRELKMEMERQKKRVSDSCTEQVHVLFPRHLNHAGRLYGGQLLEWLDEIAGVVAARHSMSGTVTASIDRLDFRAGASLGDTVYIRGYLTYVGNTSMEVRMDSFVEDMRDGKRSLINTAFFVMVAVDENGKPTQVPELILETEMEKAQWEAGKRRQENRRMRKKEGF